LEDVVACHTRLLLPLIPFQEEKSGKKHLGGNKVAIETATYTLAPTLNTLRLNKSTKNFFINIFMCFIRP
jgi:hypothetical protein